MNVLNILPNKKTYITAGLMAVVAVAKGAGVDVPGFEGTSPGDLLMQALSFAFLRKGFAGYTGVQQ